MSICRVPKHSLGKDVIVEDPHTGCLGCASGPGGQRNIFGNKFGQYLAAIQVSREHAQEILQARRLAETESSAGKGTNKRAAAAEEDDDEEGEEEGPETVWAANEQERTLETAEAADGAKRRRQMM